MAARAGPEHAEIVAKLNKARALFGGIDALRHIATWHTPQIAWGCGWTSTLLTCRDNALSPFHTVICGGNVK
jgi:hypothetical protein